LLLSSNRGREFIRRSDAAVQGLEKLTHGEKFNGPGCVTPNSWPVNISDTEVLTGG
jgi:hypothetical protein